MEKQLVFVFVFKSLFFDGTLLKSVIRTFYFCYAILLFPNFSNLDIYYNITIMNIVIYVCELSAYVTMSVFRVSVRPCKVKVIITNQERMPQTPFIDLVLTLRTLPLPSCSQRAALVHSAPPSLPIAAVQLPASASLRIR